MAEISWREVQKQIHNITECSVCSETFRDPRLLPCVHTFCFECIKGFTKDKQPQAKVPCPLCRQEFEIPDNGVNGLSKNFFVEQLKGIARIGLTTNLCDVCVCHESDQKTEATMYCVDCRDKLCDSCVHSHKIVKFTKNHKLIKIGEDSSEIMYRSVNVYCDKHPEEVLKLYCFDCTSAICLVCFVESHDSHKRSSVNTVAEDFRCKLTELVSRVEEAATKCRKMLDQQNQSKDEFSREVDDLERRICQRAEELKDLIDQHKKTLVEDLATLKMERLKHVGNFVEQLAQHVSFADSLTHYTGELTKKGSAIDVVQQTNNLQQRAIDLTKLNAIEQRLEILGSCHVSFNNSTWLADSLGENLVGDIVRCNNAKQIHVTSEGNPIYGLTTINDELYIAYNDVDDDEDGRVGESNQNDEKKATPASKNKSDSSQSDADVEWKDCISYDSDKDNETQSTFVSRNKSYPVPNDADGDNWDDGKFIIDVLDVETLDFKRHQPQVPGLGWVSDMESCDEKPLVYVADNDNNLMHTTNNESETTQWHIKDEPHGLSLNPAGNVLVTCFEVGKIKEFTTVGQLIREIGLQSDVFHPFHAMELTTNQYVVCHGNVGDPQHRVCVVNSSGCVLRSVGGSPGSGSKQFNVPIRLAAVRETIFVADRGNHRVVQLSLSLVFIREVVSGLRCPMRMSFDERTCRLYVADNKKKYQKYVSGHVEVYSI